MPTSLRNTIVRRRFRLAQAIIIAGSLALGLLVLGRLVDFFQADFFLYYGVPETELHQISEQADARMPLTVGWIAIAAMALAVIAAFVRSEHRRVRQAGELDAHCRQQCAAVVVEQRVGLHEMFDQFIARTSGFAGLLFSVWLLQSSFERYLSGNGLGLEYADYRSLLPLASVFGLCVLVGMLVSAISMVGLRAIHVLEAALAGFLRSFRVAIVRAALPHAIVFRRTFRELRGCEILSRPPPAFA